MCFGCTSSKPTDSLHIVISGDTAGWITPCGCAINQSGGLERRASLLNKFSSKEKRLYLDVGGSASGTSEYQQVKLNAILNGDRDMGLELHNIGVPESQFSPQALSGFAAASDIQWVSANLEAVESSNLDRKPSFATHKIIERAGFRLLVTGVIDSAMLKNTQWRAKDPASCILDVIGKQKADVVLVLAYMDEPGLRALAESLPEVDFIVGGPTGQTLAPTRVGTVQILSATNKGKFLSHIELKPSTKKWEVNSIGSAEVTSSIERDPSQSANVERYLATLAEKDFASNETGLITMHTRQSTSNYQIAGSTTCVECHKSDDQIWHSSKHANAWKTLVDKNWHVDPACQQCHTTGYGMQGGFAKVSTTQAMGNVGCESCHGPSQAHVSDPKIRTPYLAREQCIRCHDHENSPEFAFPAYWEKVVHGKPVAKQ